MAPPRTVGLGRAWDGTVENAPGPWAGVLDLVVAARQGRSDQRHTGEATPMHTLSSMFDAAVACYPDRPFFVGRDGSVTYEEFDQRAGRLSDVLAASGTRAGDPLGILLPTGLELALTYWAAQKAGAVPVPLNPMFRATELAAALAVIPVGVMVTDGAGATELERVEGSVGTTLVWGGDGGRGIEDRLRARDGGTGGGERDGGRLPDDPASMFFTSGTTGRAKAVVQTQLNHQSALTTMFVHNGLRYGSEVVLNTMPLFNNFGASGIMNLSVFAGATMVSLDRWDPARALDLMTEHGVTMVLGTPTIYVDLCARFDPARHDLSHVRTAIVAGASAAPALIDEFEQITGVVLRQVYGATETAGIVIGEAPGDARRPGSIGRVAGSSVVHVLDDDGTVLGTGEPGELVIAGDVVSPGYYEDPEAQAAFTPQGWRSGDVAYCDEDGFYYLVDRKKDMIICGGNNIYPAEVEAVLAQHPAIASSAVVGVPDERRGEVPAAVVVLRRGESLTPEAVVAHCRDLLAAYKAPRLVYFSDSLPLGPTGKVLKSELREDVVRMGESGGSQATAGGRS